GIVQQVTQLKGRVWEKVPGQDGRGHNGNREVVNEIYAGGGLRTAGNQGNAHLHCADRHRQSFIALYKTRIRDATLPSGALAADHEMVVRAVVQGVQEPHGQAHFTVGEDRKSDVQGRSRYVGAGV